MSLGIDFKVIADPTGHGEGLRLRGDWVFVFLSDGRATGVGEATHSGDDRRCVQVMRRLFDRHVRNLTPDVEHIWELEQGPLAPPVHAAPAGPAGLLRATAISALDQALYDLAARRQGAAVWQLFAERPACERLELYTSINRCLSTRTADEYRQVAAEVARRGFRHLKCAPFERVTAGGRDPVGDAQAGLAILRMLRSEFPQMGLRVDCHQRFTLDGFLGLVPELEELSLEWIEEPFAPGPGYLDLKKHVGVRLAAGELYFGVEGFRPLLENAWADVVMPDVKHVGGFGPMLAVCTLAGEHGLEVSPHNPSGPVSTLASLHAAAVCPCVTSLELPFDRDRRRRRFGEPVAEGYITLPDGPGWGIEPQLLRSC